MAIKVNNSLNFNQKLENIKQEFQTIDTAALRKRAMQLAIAYQTSLDVNAIFELEKSLELLIERITAILNAEISSIMLLDDKRKELKIKIARGIKEEVIKQVRVRLGEGISGWVAKEAKPLLIDNLNDYPGFKKRFRHYTTDSLLSVPLVARNEVIGVINVTDKSTKDIFKNEDLDVLMAVANQVALTIRNSQEYQQLKRLDQTKTDFLSKVSHELRTPLTNVNEAVGLVLDKRIGSLNPKQVQFLRMAKRNIAFLSRLINDLLDISKMEAGKIQMQRRFIDINSLIRNVVKYFKSQAESKSIKIKIKLDKGIKGIWADADRLTQVLDNLLNNALKFTSPNGTVSVSLAATKKAVELSVEDTGRGIPQEKLDKIFDKFSALAINKKGVVSTGLGLYITKEIVELHQGKIDVTSSPGVGTKFKITLPKDLRVGL